MTIEIFINRMLQVGLALDVWCYLKCAFPHRKKDNGYFCNLPLHIITSYARSCHVYLSVDFELLGVVPLAAIVSLEI